MSQATDEADPQYIFKILSTPPSTPLPAIFPLSDLDRTSGFIHLSRKRQLFLPLSRFFADVEEITLLKIAYDTVKDEIRWDEIASGDKYPHLYRDLRGADVQSWKTFKRQDRDWDTVLEADQKWVQ